ncbi:C10 family peptidase [Marinifilum caeruleilacunae]|uniref:Peptidase C39-like domain-containing protein n=1 Tax=Marinifilum caeruleilacunae TaxID=2499076 RepID=A0ABX1X0Z6_9BACT|nr:C10 family peptidase [Marinifilum caeruleilacunae]NOU62084.1 hypothetical protein [Marinifilum caeruleilacunae]
MKYHEHPSTYNWSNMPNYGATADTYNLIKDIHDNIGIWYYGQWLSKVDYNCGSTSVPTNFATHKLFTRAFNYTSARSSNYNTEVIKNELRQGKPIILSGGRESGWWIFTSYSGHMWVCDGFRRQLI